MANLVPHVTFPPLIENFPLVLRIVIIGQDFGFSTQKAKFFSKKMVSQKLCITIPCGMGTSCFASGLTSFRVRYEIVSVYARCTTTVIIAYTKKYVNIFFENLLNPFHDVF